MGRDRNGKRTLARTNKAQINGMAGMQPAQSWEGIRDGDVKHLEHGFCPYNDYVFNTTYYANGIAPPASKLADDECAHGRLPGDRTPPCGCYVLLGSGGESHILAREAA